MIYTKIGSPHDVTVDGGQHRGRDTKLIKKSGHPRKFNNNSGGSIIMIARPICIRECMKM